MKTLQFFYKHPKFLTILNNIVYHMRYKNKDFPLAIVGNEGVGKSNFLLHFYELWYWLAFKRKVTAEDIKNINIKREDWLNNFKNVEPLDINANDEASDGLASKETMARFNRDLEKVFKVIRKKRVVSVLLTPSFFDLPKYWRERIRLLIYINKEGKFKVYTPKGIMFLNGLNNNRPIKSMHVAHPIYKGVFPLYEGALLKPYEDKSQEGSDRILDEVIESNIDNGKNKEMEEIVRMQDMGLTQEQIGRIKELSRSRISQKIKEYVNS